MNYIYRKSYYRCRYIFCKHVNIVWERLDENGDVILTAPAWRERCGGCGRGSFDLTHQSVMKPKGK